MSTSDQETYIKRLAKLGYCWQFITLAGLHQTALISDSFSKDYAARGMRAYGETIQSKEQEVSVLLHHDPSTTTFLSTDHLISTSRSNTNNLTERRRSPQTPEMVRSQLRR
jgi:isocitrate lyase